MYASVFRRITVVQSVNLEPASNEEEVQNVGEGCGLAQESEPTKDEEAVSLRNMEFHSCSRLGWHMGGCPAQGGGSGLELRRILIYEGAARFRMSEPN